MKNRFLYSLSFVLCAVLFCFTSEATATLHLFQDHRAAKDLNLEDQPVHKHESREHNLYKGKGTFDIRQMKFCESQILKAAKKYDIPPMLLYAVGLTETGQKNSLQPYALNIEGHPVFAKSLQEALTLFEKAKKDGAVLIDVGCMQINAHYHGKEFPSIEAMFNPALNVDYAARFLKELYQREKSWTMAIARYHAGPHNNPAQKKYICLVINNLVAVGFGSWTPQSRKFCFS